MVHLIWSNWFAIHLTCFIHSNFIILFVNTCGGSKKKNWVGCTNIKALLHVQRCRLVQLRTTLLDISQHWTTLLLIIGFWKQHFSTCENILGLNQKIPPNSPWAKCPARKFILRLKNPFPARGGCPLKSPNWEMLFGVQCSWCRIIL